MKIEKHLFTSKQKIEWWGQGEWVEEADQVTFTHYNMQCKIIRVAVKEPYAKEEFIFGGYLCGYVKIPNDHPYRGKHYDDMEISCHGGLSFAKENNEKEYWIGFDCTHSFDYCPSIEKFRKENVILKCIFPIPDEYKNMSLFNPVYRNIQYCIDECKDIVMQLRAQDPNLLMNVMNEKD